MRIGVLYNLADEILTGSEIDKIARNEVFAVKFRNIYKIFLFIIFLMKNIELRLEILISEAIVHY